MVNTLKHINILHVYWFLFVFQSLYTVWWCTNNTPASYKTSHDSEEAHHGCVDTVSEIHLMSNKQLLINTQFCPEGLCQLQESSCRHSAKTFGLKRFAIEYPSTAVYSHQVKIHHQDITWSQEIEASCMLTSSAGPQSACSAEAAHLCEPAVVGSPHCRTQCLWGTFVVAARANGNST